mmetsp:Transcript_4722/g.10819  ORF Transcript_4722/g.10819 Transcript_4722/m.10819 type:complete len:242 (+) Transcript_4722:1123-1848(+)
MGCQFVAVFENLIGPRRWKEQLSNGRKLRLVTVGDVTVVVCTSAGSSLGRVSTYVLIFQPLSNKLRLPFPLLLDFDVLELAPTTRSRQRTPRLDSFRTGFDDFDEVGLAVSSFLSGLLALKILEDANPDQFPRHYQRNTELPFRRYIIENDRGGTCFRFRNFQRKRSFQFGLPCISIGFVCHMSSSLSHISQCVDDDIQLIMKGEWSRLKSPWWIGSRVRRCWCCAFIFLCADFCVATVNL